MKISTVGRCIRDGFKNVFRNGLMSLASVGTISATLLILGIVYCLVMNVQSFTGDLNKNLGLVAFLKNGITEAEVSTLTAQLDQRDDIDYYRYVSAEEAWAEFKQEMLGGDEIGETLMEDLEADNPLANSANIEIHASSASKQQAIVEFLVSSPLVRKVSYSANASRTLSSFAKLVTYVGIALIAFLIFIAILLIVNTIRVSVYNRRHEINIMKYIGATDGFVRLPFIVEGILIGFFGAILPTLLIYFGYMSVMRVMSERFTSLATLLTILDVNEIMQGLLPIFLLLSVGVGAVGSFISIRKHLRV